MTTVDVISDPTIPRRAIEHANHFVCLGLSEGLRYPDLVEKSYIGGVLMRWVLPDLEYQIETTETWALGSCVFSHPGDVPVSSFDPTNEADCLVNVNWIKQGIGMGS